MNTSGMTPDAAAALARAGFSVDRTTARFSRRAFLKGSGALIVGFSVANAAGRFGLVPDDAFAQAANDRRNQLDSWIAIAADGSVVAYTGKCELGQGLFMSQTQLVAEELSVPLNRVRLIQCDTGVTPDQGTTSGAGSHPANFNRAGLGLAAATARHTLIGLAATRLSVPAAQLSTRDGAVIVTADASRRATYAELIGGRTFQVALDPAAARGHGRHGHRPARVRAQRPGARHASRPAGASARRRRLARQRRRKLDQGSARHRQGGDAQKLRRRGC